MHVTTSTSTIHLLFQTSIVESHLELYSDIGHIRHIGSRARLWRGCAEDAGGLEPVGSAPTWNPGRPMKRNPSARSDL